MKYNQMREKNNSRFFINPKNFSTMRNFILSIILFYSVCCFSQWKLAQLGQDITTLHYWDNAQALSADGRRMVYSDPLNNQNKGQVVVVELNDSDEWVQMGNTITDANEAVNGYFGNSVKMSDNGERIAVHHSKDFNGIPRAGGVLIYDWNGTDWVQVASIDDATESEETFGFYIDLSGNGNRLVVGSYLIGKIYVYEWDGSTFNLLGSAISPELSVYSSPCGRPESICSTAGSLARISNDGSTIISADVLHRVNPDVTDLDNGVSDKPEGRMMVHQYNGSDWVQIGQDIILDEYDVDNGLILGFFGLTLFDIAINNNGTRIGFSWSYYTEEPLGPNDFHGAMKIYDLDVSGYDLPVWVQVGNTYFSKNGFSFGEALEFSGNGDMLAVANAEADDLYGRVQTMELNGDEWEEVNFITGTLYNGWFGTSIALSEDGTVLAVRTSR